MKRLVTALALSFLALLTSCAAAYGQLAQVPQPAAPVSYSATWPMYFKASLRIARVCANGVSGGHGLAISPTLALTAAHVVDCKDGSSPVMIWATPGGTDESVPLTIVKINKDADAVVLRIAEGRFAAYVPVDKTITMPQFGDDVCHIGGDVDVSSLVKCGKVGLIGLTYFVVAGHVAPGNSGSPVVDARGRVIGIVSRGQLKPEREMYAYVIPVRAFRDLLS